MNNLQTGSRGRTKGDIDEVRHIYLDFDVKGDEAVHSLQSRNDIPTPNHLVESSPGKWQVVWRVEGFEHSEAEALMRGMVQEFGADPAATDVSRVLRVPGFYNHKYAAPHLVRSKDLTDEVYSPARFPQYPDDERGTRAVHVSSLRASPNGGGGNTQSERDWAYANRALARGDDPQEVIRAIESYRPDKPNPHYYAEHTVQKALRTQGQPEPAGADPDR